MITNNKEERAMARVDRDRRYLSWPLMGIIAAMIVLGFCALMHGLRSDLADMRKQDTALQLTMNVMDMEYADLALELERVGSEGYVENEARENYGFIREGEIIFAFSDPDELKGYTEEEYQIIMDEMRD